MSLEQSKGVKIVTIIPTENEGSRFVESWIPFEIVEDQHAMSSLIPAVSVSFRWTQGEFDFGFHRAPRRRLVIALEGGLECETTDGEIRVFRPGDILEIQDTSGRGHCSRAFAGQPFRTAFIALDNDIKFDRRAALSTDPNRTLPYQSIDLINSTTNESGPANLPYVLGGIEGVVTAEFPIREFRYLVANGASDFESVQASETQFELVLTGGFAQVVSDKKNVDVNKGGLLLTRCDRSAAFDRRFSGGPADRFLSIVATGD